AVAAGPAAALARLDEVAPRVVRQGPQPAAETLGGVVGEGPHPLGQPGQHHLCDVLGVGLLQRPPVAPGVDAPAVSLHQLRPGGLVRRLLPEAAEQSRASVRVGRTVHESLLLWGERMDTGFGGKSYGSSLYDIVPENRIRRVQSTTAAR